MLQGDMVADGILELLKSFHLAITPHILELPLCLEPGSTEFDSVVLRTRTCGDWGEHAPYQVIVEQSSKAEMERAVNCLVQFFSPAQSHPEPVDTRMPIPTSRGRHSGSFVRRDN